MIIFVSYYNCHQQIAYPKEPPLLVGVGGVPFIVDIYRVHRFHIARKVLGKY